MSLTIEEGQARAAEYAEAARLRRERRLSIRESNKRIVADAIKHYGLHFMHVRTKTVNEKGFGQVHTKGGLTLAWSRVGKGRNVAVSVATVHEKDSYCKETGRLQAVLHFENGETIVLHVPRNTTPTALLAAMFQPAAQRGHWEYVQ
jgi:hypothetical protein